MLLSASDVSDSPVPSVPEEKCKCVHSFKTYLKMKGISNRWDFLLSSLYRTAIDKLLLSEPDPSCGKGLVPRLINYIVMIVPIIIIYGTAFSLSMVSCSRLAHR